MIVTILSGDTSGGGAASGTSDQIARGFLIGGTINYSGSADAGSDVVISETNGLQRTLVTLTDQNTDRTLNPFDIIETTAGVDVTGAHHPFYVESSRITVTVAQGGAAVTDHCTVKLQFLEA
jgi:hypothetical protein